MSPAIALSKHHLGGSLNHTPLDLPAKMPQQHSSNRFLAMMPLSIRSLLLWSHPDLGGHGGWLDCAAVRRSAPEQWAPLTARRTRAVPTVSLDTVPMMQTAWAVTHRQLCTAPPILRLSTMVQFLRQDLPFHLKRGSRDRRKKFRFQVSETHLEITSSAEISSSILLNNVDSFPEHFSRPSSFSTRVSLREGDRGNSPYFSKQINAICKIIRKYVLSAA